MADEKKNNVEVTEFDSAIVDLGIALVKEAKTTTNTDYKFKLLNSIVALRGALPPIYAVNQRR